MDRRVCHTVSVVIPTHNRAHLIGRAIESVLAQTRAVQEIIVVDDGSSDSTAEVLHKLATSDVRVRYLYQEQAGAPAARNRGISEASGSLIAFQDSDDEWDPRFLEKLIKYHATRNVVSFASMITVRESGEQSVEFPNLISNATSVLRRRNCVSTQSALIDASLLRTSGFDESLPRLQDWDLWLGLIGEARFLHHPEPLVLQHLQPSSITSGTINLYIALRIITRKHWRVMMRRPFAFSRLWLACRWNLALEARRT